MKIWSWRQAILQSQLGATTKLVLLALSTYMNEHGDGCYPSQEQIATDCSLTVRAVVKHLNIAISSGFLVKEKRGLTGRKWDANEYEAALPEQDAPQSEKPAPENAENDGQNTRETLAKNPEKGVNDIHPTAPRGEPRSCQGVNHVHLRGEPRSHELFIELSNEHSTLSRCEGSGGGGRETLFDVFWMLWPAGRRCERKNAKTRWQEATRKTDPQVILAAARRYVASEEARRGYAPYPAKWLKNERWLEQHTSASGQPDSSVPPPAANTPAHHALASAQARLKAKLGDAVFASWLRGLRIANTSGTRVWLCASSRFSQQVASERYGAAIAEALEQQGFSLAGWGKP